MSKQSSNRGANIAITREGWYYLGVMTFVIAGAIVRDINLMYIMAGMMMGPLLYSLYAATKSLRRISLQRRFQPLVGVGYPLYVEVSATKPKGSARAYSTVVYDSIRRDGSRASEAVTAKLYFPHIAAAGTVDASWRTTLNRRGRYRIGPMRVATSMPLGLIRAAVNGSDDGSVLVSPRLGNLSPAWSRYLELRNDGGQKSARRRGNAEGDFYGMRDWRNGDSRTWIHWRTSAKRNKLTVRQFEQRINQDLVVILDLWQPKNTDTLNPDLEAAISFVATLVLDYGKQGSTHLMVASNSQSAFTLQGTSSPVFRNDLMERLAMVKPTTSDLLPEVLARVLSSSSSKAKLVLVTSREVNLNDTTVFDAVWKRTDIRRSLGDIAIVNTTSPEFADWFTLDLSTSKSDSERAQAEAGAEVTA